MILYKLDNGIGSYWVIAENSYEAEKKLIEVLRKYDYGLSKSRQVKTISIIAESIDDQFLTDKFLIL